MSTSLSDETETFIEVGHYQVCKYKQHAYGDNFLSRKNQTDGRVITTLSDGLGSGIKASVLATLTATMATSFVEADMPIKRAAEIIMNTLPVCKKRGISYATFTLVDIEPSAEVRIIEYDNPPYVLIREETLVEPIKEFSKIQRKNKATGPKKDAVLQFSKYTARPGDRLVFFSDGVTQSGMGTKSHPFGWGGPEAQTYILNTVRENPLISARNLARNVVKKAEQNDVYKAKDDISCCVIYFRKPRDLLIVTGPPLHKEKDIHVARAFSLFDGIKIICGGTTANIISRELNRPVTVDITNIDPKIPPVSSMKGVELITEGIITLGAVAELLEKRANIDEIRANAASKILNILLDSDRINFMVGTKINDAHQDPNMPVELEIRRNIVKKIAGLLEEKYLKQVHISYY
ncbi:MAG TPA: PP2C family protein-serine/threonine phosphatase [Treponemataceae bacterium]|nr:PP2C family protein-serine/threonine phosphatase [Treponemataceae bacterium]